MTTHVSTLKLHAYRYGELDPAERAVVTAHLAECGVCRERYQVQQANRAEFVARPVPPAIAGSARASRGWWLRPVWLAPVLAAATVVVAVGVWNAGGDGLEVGRLKGEGAAVEVWVDGGEGTVAIGAGDALDAGDRVQLRVDADGAAWVAVAGRDGTGRVEVYGVVAGRDSAFDVPFALVLDDAPGPQTFFAVTGDHELSHDEVRAAIAAGSPDVHEITVAKRVKER